MRHLVVRANKLLYRRFFSPEFKTSATLKVGFLRVPKPLPPASDLCADIRSTSSMTRILHNQEIGRFPRNHEKTWNSSNSAKTEKTGKSADFWETHKSRAIPDSGVPDPRIQPPPAGDPRIALPDPG